MKVISVNGGPIMKVDHDRIVKDGMAEIAVSLTC